MAGTYNIISITAFCLSVVSLIASITFWFVFKIPELMRGTGGRIGRKAAAEKKNLDKKPSHNVHGEEGEEENTSKSGGGETQDMGPPEKEAGKSNRAGGTVQLGGRKKEAESLQTGTRDLQRGTKVLQEGTVVFDGTVEMSGQKPPAEKFELIQNIIFIHTDERI